jgi:hypothetical protein
MTYLLWRRAKDMAQIPARTPLQSGLEVCMEAREVGPDDPVHSFHLLRVFSPPVRALMRRRNLPEWRYLDDIFPAYALDGGMDDRSAAFPLVASGFFATHRWRFRAESRSGGSRLSPEVRTARFMDVALGIALGTPSASPITARLDAKATVPTGLDDPTVTFSPIFPWRSEGSELTIADLFAQELEDGEGEAARDGGSAGDVLDFFSSYLPETPPAELAVEIAVDGDPQIEPGESRTVTVEIGLGGLDDHYRGVAVALEARDVENPDNRAVSDVVMIELTEAGPVVRFADAVWPYD